jgi:KDO2-lipid IV(A) lauroyltransferase
MANPLVRFVVCHAHRLPLGAALALGRGMGWLAPHISARHRRRVAGDIRRALDGAVTPADAERMAVAAYMHLGENMWEFIRMPACSRERMATYLRLEGREILDAACAGGQGVIAITAHLGNWELGCMALAAHGYPYSAIARSQLDAEATAFINCTREHSGGHVIDMTDVRAALRVLRRGEVLGIVADVNANSPGAFVNFFGHPAATFTGAAHFAITTGAPIVPMFDERLPDHSHVVRIGDPINVSRTGDMAHDLLVTTIRCQHVIQEEIRKRPEQWFWLIQRWKTRPEDVPNPERIPMEHRDLTPEQSALIRAEAQTPWRELFAVAGQELR